MARIIIKRGKLQELEKELKDIHEQYDINGFRIDFYDSLSLIVIWEKNKIYYEIVNTSENSYVLVQDLKSISTS